MTQDPRRPSRPAAPAAVAATATDAICRAVNAALALDPEAEAILAPLDGATIAIEVTGVGTGAVTVGAGRFAASEPGAAADLTISGGAGEFARIVFEFARQLPGGGDAELPAGLRFSGDVAVAQRLVRALRRLRPDWEAPLTRIFGEVAGHQLARTLAGAGTAARDGAQNFAEDVAEYLREEVDVLVGRAELAAFADGVDDARDAVERLAQRLARLESRLREGGPGADPKPARDEQGDGADGPAA